MSEFLEQIPLKSVVGLRPKAWICVGQGFAREEIKARLLQAGGLTARAVIGLTDLARLIVDPGLGADRVLGSLSRQEILRVLLADSHLKQAFEEIKILKRQNGFLRRLDTAIQAGRMAFAHSDEESVLEERLAAIAAPRRLRRELSALAQVYEAQLEEKGLWDPPLLLRRATERLREGWPAEVARPETIYYFSAQTAESLEREFCEAVSRELEWVRVYTPTEGPAENSQISYERWHTIDDAVERLADTLAEESDLSGHVVLIPEAASIRRSLNRALAERGIPQADPRDPTRIRWDEELKKAMLPLEVLAGDFDRVQVIAWARAEFAGDPRLGEWVTEIHSRGARRGRSVYAGGRLVELHSRLEKLARAFEGRLSVEQIAEAHLSILRSRAEPWAASFFEKIWGEFVEDLAHAGESGKRAPFRFWFERFRQRVSETDSPVEALKPESGLAVYRFHQVPLKKYEKVWCLGLAPDFLGGESGDAWWSARERELLSAEFAVRGAAQIRVERVGALREWLGDAQAVFLDADYDFEGRERETLLPLLREVLPEVPEPVAMGSHPRWVASYGALRPLQPQKVELPPVQSLEKPVLTATALDRLSRCGFQGLGLHRWKLRDLREPEAELWPDVRGNILHRAVQHLLESELAMAPEEALRRAWEEKPPYGLFRSARIEAYARGRLLDVLYRFCVKEREYRERSGARPFSLENLKLKLEFPDFSVIGTPDRIDENENGLFVIDYKTSSVNPNGTEMLERGYRLQLPFYAIAAEAQLGKPVRGVQFVELNRTGSRTGGMFFKSFNGKEAGKFTNARSNSKSLLAGEPEEAWRRMREEIRTQAEQWLVGKFAAEPRIENRAKECDFCMVSDVCGYRRRGESG